MRYAVLGTGTAGAAIARRLRATGHAVVAWNRTRARAEALGADGVELAGTPAEAVSRAEVALVVVLDEPAVDAVLAALPARLEHAPLVADLTTTGHDATVSAMRRLAAAGARPVKAPFFGSVPEAAAGRLFFTLGCAEVDERVAREALAPLGETFRVGDPETCAKVKLAVNPLVFVMVSVLAEALALARGQGVDPQLVLDVLARGTGVRAPIYEGRGRMMLAGDYAARASVDMALTDLAAIEGAARDARLTLPVTAAAHAAFRRARDAGFGHEDMAAVAKAVA